MQEAGSGSSGSDRADSAISEDVVRESRESAATSRPRGDPETGEWRLFRSFFEEVPASALILDRDLRVLRANQNFFQRAKTSAEVTIGRKLQDIFPSVILRSTSLLNDLHASLATGRKSPGSKMVYRAPGVPTQIYYYSVTPIAGPSGEVNGAILLMEDITQREHLGAEVRRIERHLASVVESVSDIVVSMDRTGRIQSWNAAGEEISGFRADELREASFQTIFAPLNHEEIRRLLDGTGLPQDVRDKTMGLITSGGEEIPVSWSFSPLRDQNGRGRGVVGVGRDLRERKRLEAQIIQTAKMAALGVMAGGIAHEIRNPIGVCSSAAQLWMENPHDTELASECVSKIRHQLNRASEIIENLLRFARPKEERFTLCSMNSLLQDTFQLVANQFRLERINCATEFDPSCPRIPGNPSLLQQAFLNIMLNAIHSMPNGGDFRISTTWRCSEVTLRFDDTGTGIDQEDIAKVFDPFFTKRPLGHGTGLGLSVTYSIIKQHGGRILVSSGGQGLGTQVVIQLPAGQG